MSSIVHANGTFYLDETPPKHRCQLPSDEDQWPDGFEPDYWECGVCGQVYSITISAWTGWWSLDMSMDSKEGVGEDGITTIFCKWETYTDCPPSVRLEPRKPNNIDVNAISFGHPNPGPRPEWLPPLPQNRRLAQRQRWNTATGPTRPSKREEQTKLPEAKLPWIDRVFRR